MTSPPTMLWPVHPKPLDGEVLSSWLLRTADGNGLNLSSFRRQELPKVPGAGGDIDLLDDANLFNVLAAGSGAPYETLVAAGYAGDEGSVFTRRTASSLEWVVPLCQQAEWSGKRYSSLPFCPSCLATDRIPYYRKIWRYAFLPICPTHGLLINRCPSCGEHFSYIPPKNSDKYSQGIRALRCCTNCGTAFSTSPSGNVSSLVERALVTQKFLQEGLTNGWVRSERKGTIHIAIFLRGFHDVMVSMLSPASGIKITNWIASQNGDLNYPGHGALGSGHLESRPSTARAWLLVFAYWLIQDWPTRFVSLIQETGLPASSVLPNRQSHPAWMRDHRIDNLFSAPLKRPPEEMLSAQRLLARLRGFPPNKTELMAFMETGVAPPVKSLSQPVVLAARRAIDEELKFLGQRVEVAEIFAETSHDRPRELYPALRIDSSLDDFFVDTDDTDSGLASLKKNRHK